MNIRRVSRESGFGRTLARAHGRSGDQDERDYEIFCAAVDSGRLDAGSGV